MLDAKVNLLQDIKAAIKDVISTDLTGTDPTGTDLPVMTDELRRDLLNILITYSDKIPHPASGTADNDGTDSRTLVRWQVLAYVASIDLTIIKWFESHLDALSILHELGYDKAVKGLCAVWASEGHPDPIRYQQGKISGTKAWCSGANIVNYGVITYRDEHGRSQLLVVDMQQDGIAIDNSGWQAVGMQATDTATITFDQVTADTAGEADAYLERVGFWHGAAGVAACWYGAASYIATYLIQSYQKKPNDYKAMYLGQVGTALSVTQQYFHHVAQLIDTQPTLSHELAIRELRAHVEQVARQVIESAGQALGAAPFCGNAHFARLSADLSVFIRQSHGAFDLQKIGELSSTATSDLTDGQVNIWQL
ncbi:acyl-CoA dehydrogenase family protein [Psychrobacter sp. FBL11]|uniref:Acyl-CoA dehydrogenase family protein n=1 Tax=Psychrobacter saeujeotis TaxID=3143436 RepID=A0ABU9X960_9GAMM|nr:acyl-CoA dehydrogenase family protein [uncultured Psychrobacter sp.]